MWAQLITMRLKPGKEGDVTTLMEQLRAIEQPDSGLIRTTTFRDQSDPLRVSTLVVFGSEEQARARENDPRRQDGLQGVRATIAEITDGAPEFVDFEVIEETSV